MSFPRPIQTMCRRFVGLAICLGTIVSVLGASATSHASLFDGNGTEGTFLYNKDSGHLMWDSHTGSIYSALVLSTDSLSHFDLDHLDSEFRLSTHPGLNGEFWKTGVTPRKAADSETIVGFDLRYIYFSETCGDCLTGDIDFGRVMLREITKSEILSNWQVEYATFPMGGTNSTDDPSAVGLRILELGDGDGDGTVTGLDIDPFVYALTHTLAEYKANYPTYVDPLFVYDFDGDRVITGLDIDPFVTALTSGLQVVPEPNSASHLLPVCLFFVCAMRRFRS